MQPCLFWLQITRLHRTVLVTSTFGLLRPLRNSDRRSKAEAVTATGARQAGSTLFKITPAAACNDHLSSDTDSADEDDRLPITIPCLLDCLDVNDIAGLFGKIAVLQAV